uniref:BTB_2 domain-containing protein n=1 Tax=Syphacia muris TaxID=451379 RepID=A0A0N5AKJ4_9BILA
MGDSDGVNDGNAAETENSSHENAGSSRKVSEPNVTKATNCPPGSEITSEKNTDANEEIYIQQNKRDLIVRILGKNFSCSTLIGNSLERFLKTDQQRFEKMLYSNKHNNQETTVYDGIETAAAIQYTFHNLALISQGFVSGFSAAHALLALSLDQEACRFESRSNIHNLLLFQQLLSINYSHFAMPIHMIFFVFLVISTVSSFDRLDVRTTWCDTLKKGIFVHGCGLASLFWLVATTLTVSLLKYDDYLSQSAVLDYNTTSLEIARVDFNTYNINSFDVWRWLCFSRAVAALFGWLMISLSPNCDNLLVTLQKLSPF